MITRYQSRISGPLLDRIDIHVTVPRVDYNKLMGTQRGESSAAIRERIEAARVIQAERFANYSGMYANADMGPGEIQEMCAIEKDARDLLQISVRKMQLSARAYHRTLKLSRTIADLDAAPTIAVAHVAEALQYRPRQPA